MSAAEGVLATAVVVAPVLCCLPLARPHRPGRVAAGFAVLTVVIALVWDRHRAAYEGPAIFVVWPGRGVTVVDFVVPLALAVAAAVLWRRWRG